jgi:hypothetical protein
VNIPRNIMKNASGADNVECSLCRLIRRSEHLIGRHWYLPANWRSFIRWSPEQWVSQCYAIECYRSFCCVLLCLYDSCEWMPNQPSLWTPDISDYLDNARLDIDYTNFIGEKALIFTTREKFLKPPLITEYDLLRCWLWNTSVGTVSSIQIYVLY